MYLIDIVHLCDQFSDKDSRICFYQKARWYEVINNMLRFQSRPYTFAASESTMTFIENQIRDGVIRDQSWYWSKSQEVQHSELAHADIRKGLEAAGF
jgi:son of sevenless-like protein